MKHNWRSLGPFVTAARMVRDYMTELYEPAAASAAATSADEWAQARSLATWKQSINANWQNIRVTSVDGDTGPAHEGDERTARAHVYLNGLQASDVNVQLLHGSIDSTGEFVGRPEAISMTHLAGDEYTCTYPVHAAGPYGFTVRVLPTHPALISAVELGKAAWAS